MSEIVIRFVPAAEIPGATPGRPGGTIAVAVDDFGHQIPMTATQYHAQEHQKIRIFELWRDLRFLAPDEIHPDDYRMLYPENANLPDSKVKEILKRVATRYRPSS